MAKKHRTRSEVIPSAVLKSLPRPDSDGPTSSEQKALHVARDVVAEGLKFGKGPVVISYQMGDLSVKTIIERLEE